MAKITRKVAKQFGSSSGFHEVAQFGSLAAASPVFTTDPDVIQNLANWLSGWYGAVVGFNSPAIQDMNAFCLVMAYQVAYLMQTGVAEWNTDTIYFKGSLASDTGRVFVSKTDTNTGNALTDSNNWQVAEGATVSLVFADSGYVLSGTNKWEKTALVNTAGGGTTVALPAAATCTGAILRVIKTSADANIVTIDANGGEFINGVLTQTIEDQYTSYDFLSIGTGWIVV